MCTSKDLRALKRSCPEVEVNCVSVIAQTYTGDGKSSPGNVNYVTSFQAVTPEHLKLI